MHLLVRPLLRRFPFVLLLLLLLLILLLILPW
jgi:hypothetical protein